MDQIYSTITLIFAVFKRVYADFVKKKKPKGRSNCIERQLIPK